VTHSRYEKHHLKKTLTKLGLIWNLTENVKFKIQIRGQIWSLNSNSTKFDDCIWPLDGQNIPIWSNLTSIVKKMAFLSQEQSFLSQEQSFLTQKSHPVESKHYKLYLTKSWLKNSQFGRILLNLGSYSSKLV